MLVLAQGVTIFQNYRKFRLQNRDSPPPSPNPNVLRAPAQDLLSNEPALSTQSIGTVTLACSSLVFLFVADA